MSKVYEIKHCEFCNKLTKKSDYQNNIIYNGNCICTDCNISKKWVGTKLMNKDKYREYKDTEQPYLAYHCFICDKLIRKDYDKFALLSYIHAEMCEECNSKIGKEIPLYVTTDINTKNKKKEKR